MANNKIHGKVKWFDVRKGYGFVTDDNGKDTFIHFTGIDEGRHYVGLEAGDVVEYEVGQGTKGPQAEHLKLLIKAEDAEKAEKGEATPKS